MLNFEQACTVADEIDMERANMTVEPRPELESEPFHFSDTYRDVALRHVWSQNVAKNAREVAERGLPRWI